ncbi:serine hydrolase domain-containing protein [Oceanobacillus jeddahense]|uniref:Beta-lactamase family protein n=1 Tax=Oceanobacillus jeddahense TaxID=1462527 RepID=A0ABY5JWG9_9BACI|nr:serine hydrolase [Oceanobacillus jeddahense]UUI04730.1 beta-lactamase family protein [Oceanobacillus jeddahense]
MSEKWMKNFEKEVMKDKIDSCLIQHDDKLIFEYYRNKKMKVRQHKIYSVTKSILSALVGIAIDKGYIPHVNTPIATYFPEYRKESISDEITVKHLLTMTSGLHWPGNAAMIPTKNWVEFVLSQPVEYKPGKEREYSCGSSQLLSAILQKATELDTVTFAQKHLFLPLGITAYKWNSDSQGIAIGGFGLNMKTEDLLKIGVLYMNKGQWNSKQIVPSDWVEESTAAIFKMDNTFSYGYHWWVLTGEDQESPIPETFFALGKNGQYIFVVPDYKLTAVFTSDIMDGSSRPIDYFKKYLLTNACINT